MKLSTKLTISIGTTLLVATGVGIGVGIALQNKEDESGYYPYRKMGTPKIFYFNSGTNKPSKTWDFPIKIYPYTDGSYWMNDTEIKELIKYLKKGLYHGQEIASLNGLIFGNTNMLKRDTRGIFYPHSREIFVNIEQWKNSNVSVGSKIRGTADTITHEYGHHINASYLTTSREKYSWKGDGKNKPKANEVNNDANSWNSHFMNVFYKTLNYNNTSLTTKGNTSKYKPITSKLSLNDLFWNANGERGKKADGEYWFFPVNGRTIPSDKWRNPLVSKYDAEYMNYRYSFNEIVTRQLGQLMHVMNREVDSEDVFGEDIRFTNSSGVKKRLFNGFTADANTSIQIKQSKTDKNKFELVGLDSNGNLTSKDGFYKDYMFGSNTDLNGKNVSRAEKIYEVFTSTMGYGKLVSNVQMLNDLHLNYKLRVDNSAFEKEGNEKIMPNKFRISGFAPVGISGVYYGDKSKLKESQLSKFPSANDRTSLWNFNRKANLLDQNTDVKLSKSSTTKSGWTPYVATIDSDSTKTKEFSWWKDGNKNNKLDKGELLSTEELLTTNKVMDETNITNDFLPLSTYRPILTMDSNPRVMYDPKTKKIIVSKY